MILNLFLSFLQLNFSDRVDSAGASHRKPSLTSGVGIGGMGEGIEK